MYPPMEHPALDVTQIKRDMTLEEIQEKVTDIQKRLNYAYRTGNQPLINQLTMVFNVYIRAQKEVLDEMFGDDGDGPDLDQKIDVT